MDATFGCTPWAAAKVTGATGLSTMNKRCVSAQTGPGVYTITLDEDLDAAERSASVTCRGGGAFIPEVVDTSDTVLTVHTYDDTGVAANCDFDIMVVRCI